jgi:hypothetical protein
VSDSSGVLDHCGRAQSDVSRSKEVIAAATKDLNHHDRWLNDYLASEKRRQKRYATWVERQQARERRRIMRQRVARSSKRAALQLANWIGHELAQLRDVSLICALWVASTIHSFASWVLGVLSMSISWTGAKACAVALRSLKAALSALTWTAAKVRAFALVSIRTASISSTWVTARAQALWSVSVGAAVACFAWTSARFRKLANASLNALATGGAWLAVCIGIFAISSAKAFSRVFFWTSAKALAFALASRHAGLIGSAWIAAQTRNLAHASSEAASRGSSWTASKVNAFALASRGAASVGSNWIAAKNRSFARGTLTATSTSTYFTRAKSRYIAVKLQHAALICLSCIQEAAQAAAVRLFSMAASVRAAGRNQTKRTSIIAIRLGAQAKYEITALKHAGRVGGRKFADSAEEVATAKSDSRSLGSEVKTKTLGDEEHASRKALICIEPWRCRLPVIQTPSPYQTITSS